MSIDETLKLALQHHRAGRFSEAERLYWQILAAQPDHPDALRLLGIAVCQSARSEPPGPTKRRQEAEQFVRRAVALRPNIAECHFDLAGVLRESGQLSEAAASYQRAVELRPDFVEALSILAQTLKELGRLDEAIAAAGRAVALRPDLAEAHCNLGNLLNDAGQWDRAIASCRAAIQIKPDLAGAFNNLGNAFNGLGDLEQAVAAYRRAIELSPATASFHNNLGVSLRELKRPDEALACCRRAIQLQPNDPANYSNLGSILGSLNELDQAEEAYRQALRLQPDNPEAYCNLGHIFYFKGRWDDAQVVYRNVLASRPDDPQAHWSLALIHLSRGEFEQGWVHYEWRWRVKELRMRRRTAAPQWDGGPLHGRTILLHNEQGFGDTIQFVRYLPEVARRGGKIILACQRELFSLLETMPQIHQCVPNDQPVPAHDVCCPLLGLPGLFATRLDNIPADIPYLKADPARSARWRQRLAGDSRRKIGIVWAGRPAHPNDRNRSLSPQSLSPLAEISGVHFISLQTGDAARQASAAPMPLTDWSGELKDFAETAALIDNLDLVICVDTAVAHLAGAMGKPVWVLLPFISDWRWMVDREDSPWYPTMRLFRQERIGDWQTPIARLKRELKSP
jgi:tetratricopeptide (TPR) repeat protein